MRVLAVVVLLFCLVSGCAKKTPKSEFPKVVEEFVYKSLSFSPVGASAQGLHKYEGRDLDRELDNLKFGQIRQQHQYYADIHKRLNDFDKDSLSPEERADYDIIDTQVGLALFDSDIARSWMHNPTVYVETLGTALFTPFVLEYAPKPERFSHIIARLEKTPDFLNVAQRQLNNAPEPWIKVAKQENEGNIDLVDHALRAAVPAELKQAYDKAAGPALDSLRGFTRFLDTELPKMKREKAPDWRLGADNYGLKFKLALATSHSPEEVLNEATQRLKEVRAKMLDLSTGLHAAMYPDHGGHTDLSGDARQNKIIGEVLDRIAANHSTPATYMQDAKSDLAAATAFVRAKNILTLPARANLQVIETPEFMRGIYAVGGFNSAPTLDPKLGAFYWITPIPLTWPAARIESKLREYNRSMLKLLTIHEAMPGHYVQAEFANDVQPTPRRLLRSVYGNGPYVEGWAQYATQVMLDDGFLDNSPELRLTFLKQELRVIANAIMDIRFHTNRMTEQEALDLMEKQTFQEHEEAAAKIQRAQLSSTQLPTYFVGWRDWLRVRDAVKQSKGGGFNPHDFHDRALKEGAVPLPVLNRLLTGKEL